MAFDRKWLLLNCVRPNEPTFIPKCDKRVFVDIPENYLPDRYRPIGRSLQEKFSKEAQTHVVVPRILTPDVSIIAGPVKRRGSFSLFIPSHRQVAGNLISLFMQTQAADELMSIGTFLKDRLNSNLFQYAYQVALAHHPVSKDLPKPSALEVFPDQFVDPLVFPLLQEETDIVDSSDRIIIDIPRNFTATDADDEQRLAYFREDIGVNMHHWHWHLVYPYNGPIEIVGKDRRGELFYYMHNQLIARYEAERISNGMSRIVTFTNWREPVKEGYYSKLIRNTNMRPFPGRPPNTTIKDLNRPQDDLVVTLLDLERWKENIYMAIDKGIIIVADDSSLSLNNDRGIDVLGNIIESSILSPNPDLYGDYHNTGHDFIAYSHDPDGRYLEDFGVMGGTTTAMRDPMFYRYHKHICEIFDRHKRLLPQYNRGQLEYEDVHINSIAVQIPRDNAARNLLLTFWQRSQVDLSSGLAFAPQGRAYISFIHLQHADFVYNISVRNNSKQTLMGTCRIFIAPHCDENCTPFHFNEQRLLMIEMDKFTVDLNPGENLIRRRSQDSSVAIPWERSFQAIGSINQLDTLSPNYRSEMEFCGCGWPDHMLIPKGSINGTDFDLFVMVSNFTDDTINQAFNVGSKCNEAHSFCGLQDQQYPDRRPMGFPFDRPFDISTLQEFVQHHSNMSTCEVTIRFVDSIVNRDQ